jgi:hypothetical protein
MTNDIEDRARALYERDTRKPGTVYPWNQLVAMAAEDERTRAMVERYRKEAREMG